MLDAVNDLVFIIEEDDIAVLAHDLHHKYFLAEISHLIQMLNMNPDDTFQTGLGNSGDSAVLQMLSKKHAKAGSCHGTLLV